MSSAPRTDLMSEVQRIRAQLRRAVHGHAWHGPSVMETIDGLDAAAAWARLSANSHSPVELVLHVAAWLEIVRRRLAGETVTPQPDDDWPPCGAMSDDAWRAAIARLNAAHDALANALADTPASSLAAMVAGQRITMYEMLHGAVQHSIYHAGQIMLIRRALEAR